MQQLEKVIYVEIKRHWKTMYKLSMNISLMQFIGRWMAHDISFCQLLAGKALSRKHQTCYFLNSQISWSFIRNVFFLEVLLSQEEITPVKTLALCYYMLVRSPCPSTERKTLISEKNKNKSFRCQDWFKRFRYRILHFHRINIESEYWLSLSLSLRKQILNYEDAFFNYSPCGCIWTFCLQIYWCRCWRRPWHCFRFVGENRHSPHHCQENGRPNENQNKPWSSSRQYVPFSKREIPASRNSSDTEPSFPRGPRTSPTAAGNFRRNFTTIGRWKKCVGRLPVSAVKANKSVKNIKEKKANSKMMFEKIVYRKLCADLLWFVYHLYGYL